MPRLTERVSCLEREIIECRAEDQVKVSRAELREQEFGELPLSREEELVRYPFVQVREERQVFG